MTRSRFPQPANSSGKSSSRVISVLQLFVLGLSITILAAIFVQNLQPTVQIFFLGKKALFIPLSVAMFVAFISGGFLAFVFNAIATWQHNLAIRRAVVAAGYGNEQVTRENAEVKEYDDDSEFEEEYDDAYGEYKDEDPDTVPYGDRQSLKSKDTNQAKRDHPPLDAKYIE